SDGPSGNFDIGYGVAVGASANLYVGGYVTVVGEQSQIWAGRWVSDLSQLLWHDSYGNSDSHLADEARHIALSDDEANVAAGGLEGEGGGGGVGWGGGAGGHPSVGVAMNKTTPGRGQKARPRPHPAAPPRRSLCNRPRAIASQNGDLSANSRETSPSFAGLIT